MRTTVNIPDHLLTRAKRLAVTRRTSLTEILSDSLRMYLAEQSAHEAPQDVPPLPVNRTAMARSGIDLADTSTLLEVE